MSEHTDPFKRIAELEKKLVQHKKELDTKDKLIEAKDQVILRLNNLSLGPNSHTEDRLVPSGSNSMLTEDQWQERLLQMEGGFIFQKAIQTSLIESVQIENMRLKRQVEQLEGRLAARPQVVNNYTYNQHNDSRKLDFTQQTALPGFSSVASSAPARLGLSSRPGMSGVKAPPAPRYSQGCPRIAHSVRCERKKCHYVHHDQRIAHRELIKTLPKNSVYDDLVAKIEKGKNERR